ncbi:MAG: Fic family protein [Desulfovibrionaceae bacterium]|nr:Fic family protein [Desulfovibrionaceae bacterium]
MSSGKYIPPYTVSGKAMNLIAEIAAAVERYRILLEGPDGVRLRRINHIRTIRGTTAIEGNTLTEEQITAVLAGRHVAGPQREIDEVKGAHEAYMAIESFNPYSIDDLLKAHGLLTKGLVDRAGMFRNCNVGVMDGLGNVIHMAPPYANVPSLVKDLFAWLADSEDPVLIKSCVFHYELEFIHPFQDGNGRVGRLWQTALLGSWRRELYGVPVENIVWAHQQEYYQAISASSAKGESGPFIDFMLDKILRTLRAKDKAHGAAAQKSSRKVNQKTNQETSQKSSQKIMAVMKSMPDVTLAELAEATGLSIAGVKWNIRRLKEANLVRRVGPDKGGHWEVIMPAAAEGQGKPSPMEKSSGRKTPNS